MEDNKITKIDKPTTGLIKQETINQDIQKQEAFGQDIIESRISFFKGIFPDAETKLVKSYRGKLVSVLADAKVENVRMVKEFERQVLKEALDWILTKGKINTRKEKGLFVAAHTEDYMDKMGDVVDRFWDKFIAKKAEIEKIADIDARTGKMKQLQDSATDLQDIIKSLMDEFKNILKEGV